MFYGADADLGAENDDEDAMFIDIEHERAEVFTLLIEAGKVLFAEESGHELDGVEGVGSESGHDLGVELLALAGLMEEVSGLLDQEGGAGFTLGQQIAQQICKLLDIVLIELREIGHKPGYFLPDSLINLCNSNRVIMFKVSNTPSHLAAAALKDGTCTSRLFNK